MSFEHSDSFDNTDDVADDDNTDRKTSLANASNPIEPKNIPCYSLLCCLFDESRGVRMYEYDIHQRYEYLWS